MVGETPAFLARKSHLFRCDGDSVTLEELEGPPLPDPNRTKDENLVVEEVEALVAAMGPVCYLSTVCSTPTKARDWRVTCVSGRLQHRASVYTHLVGVCIVLKVKF